MPQGNNLNPWKVRILPRVAFAVHPAASGIGASLDEVLSSSGPATVGRLTLSDLQASSTSSMVPKDVVVVHHGRGSWQQQQQQMPGGQVLRRKMWSWLTTMRMPWSRWVGGSEGRA